MCSPTDDWKWWNDPQYNIIPMTRVLNPSQVIYWLRACLIPRSFGPPSLLQFPNNNFATVTRSGSPFVISARERREESEDVTSQASQLSSFDVHPGINVCLSMCNMIMKNVQVNLFLSKVWILKKFLFMKFYHIQITIGFWLSETWQWKQTISGWSLYLADQFDTKIYVYCTRVSSFTSIFRSAN